jgi:hypothetical protein
MVLTREGDYERVAVHQPPHESGTQPRYYPLAILATT